MKVSILILLGLAAIATIFIIGCLPGFEFAHGAAFLGLLLLILAVILRVQK
jgi:hypothetical protein